MKEKIIIYQALVRLFGNGNTTREHNGTIEQNGCGKMSDFSEVALQLYLVHRIAAAGFCYRLFKIWYSPSEPSGPEGYCWFPLCHF